MRECRDLGTVPTILSGPFRDGRVAPLACASYYFLPAYACSDHTGYVEACVAVVTIYYVAELTIILVSGFSQYVLCYTGFSCTDLVPYGGCESNWSRENVMRNQYVWRAKSGASAAESGTV